MQVLSVVGFYPRVPALWTRALPSITSFDTNVLTIGAEEYDERRAGQLCLEICTLPLASTPGGGLGGHAANMGLRIGGVYLPYRLRINPERQQDRAYDHHAFHEDAEPGDGGLQFPPIR